MERTARRRTRWLGAKRRGTPHRGAKIKEKVKRFNLSVNLGKGKVPWLRKGHGKKRNSIIVKRNRCDIV